MQDCERDNCVGGWPGCRDTHTLGKRDVFTFSVVESQAAASVARVVM